MPDVSAKSFSGLIHHRAVRAAQQIPAIASGPHNRIEKLQFQAFGTLPTVKTLGTPTLGAQTFFRISGGLFLVFAF